MYIPRSLPFHVLFVGLGECDTTERYPSFSEDTCVTIYPYPLNQLLRCPVHTDLRWSHVVLTMVHTWSNTVQVIRPSLISVDRYSTILLHRPHRIWHNTHKSPSWCDRLKGVYPDQQYYYIRILEWIRTVLPSRHRRLLQSAPSSLDLISYLRHVQTSWVVLEYPIYSGICYQ